MRLLAISLFDKYSLKLISGNTKICVSNQVLVAVTRVRFLCNKKPLKLV